MRDVPKNQSEKASIGCAVMDFEVSNQSHPGGYGSFVKYDKQEEAGKIVVQLVV